MRHVARADCATVGRRVVFEDGAIDGELAAAEEHDGATAIVNVLLGLHPAFCQRQIVNCEIAAAAHFKDAMFVVAADCVTPRLRS